jgi:hypothetical protein
VIYKVTLVYEYIDGTIEKERFNKVRDIDRFNQEWMKEIIRIFEHAGNPLLERMLILIEPIENEWR